MVTIEISHDLVNSAIEPRFQVFYIPQVKNRSAIRRRLALVSSTALLVVFLGHGAVLAAQTQQEHLARAQELLDSGDAQGALELLDRLAKKKPVGAQVFLLRSTVNFMLGDIARGRDDLNRSLKVDPELRQGWLNKAALDLSEQRYSEALSALETAKRLDPTAPDNDLNIGAVQLLQGNLQEASRLFQVYLNNNSTSADAYYLVATNYAKAGYAGPAIEHLRRAIDINEQSRLRARTDPNFGELSSNERFQRVLTADTYRIPQGAYQRTIEVETRYQGSDSVLLRAVLDALQFSNQPFDRRVEVTEEWALIWGEMRIKLMSSPSGGGQILLTAPANQFTPAQWQQLTDDLAREITVRLTTRQH